ncbi:hypothetical protein H4S14_000440 [Agrobacterium vitis]|nr:hypothetical protein [Agrobacterium vitis]MBE1436713.1 hypothetical protein [Agrobacterium vitis]
MPCFSGLRCKICNFLHFLSADTVNSIVRGTILYLYMFFQIHIFIDFF